MGSVTFRSSCSAVSRYLARPVQRHPRENSPAPSFLDIIYNCIGWKNSYNHETWFLLPYTLLTLSSTKIFAVCDKFKPIKVFLFSFFVYILVRLSSRYSSSLIESYQIFKWIDSYLTLQFPFILGMLLCKYWDYSAYKKKLSFKFNKNYILTIHR